MSEQTELEKMEALSGKARAGAIVAVVRQLTADGARITCAAVDAKCFALPYWSECEADELEQAQAVVAASADDHVAKLEVEAEPETVGDNSPTAEPPETLSADNTYADRDAALANVNRLIRELGDARSEWQRAGDRLRTLRAAAAKAIECWQRGLPSTSFRDALMAVSQTQRLTKQQRQDATVPGPSAWDKQAYYSTGRGSAPAFVQKMQRGGGNRRGSLPLSAARGPMDTGGVAKVQLRRTNTGGVP